jgi:hypothetical protein
VYADLVLARELDPTDVHDVRTSAGELATGALKVLTPGVGKLDRGLPLSVGICLWNRVSLGYFVAISG